VLAAIKFYDQAMVYTAEVHDVWTDGILAPELGGGEFPTPYPHLDGVRHPSDAGANRAQSW
jgi:hypothetical protein